MLVKSLCWYWYKYESWWTLKKRRQLMRPELDDVIKCTSNL